MRSYVALAGARFELASALFEVSYNVNDPRFTCLLTTEGAETFWLAGTCLPAPRTVAEIPTLTYRVAPRGVEDLASRLAGIELRIDPSATLVLRVRHQFESAYYLTSSWSVVDEFHIAHEITAHLVDLETKF